MGDVREHEDAERDKTSLENMETVEAQVTTLSSNHNHNTQLQDTGGTDTNTPASHTTTNIANHNLNSELQDTEMGEMDMDSTHVLPSTTTNNTSISSHPTHLITDRDASDSPATTNSGISVVALNEGVVCGSLSPSLAEHGTPRKHQQSAENQPQNSDVTTFEKSTDGASQCGSEGVRDAGEREEKGSQKQDGGGDDNEEAMSDLCTEDLMKMLED